MNNCSDLYLLSSIACKLTECFTTEELELLAANLKALGELLDVAAARHTLCERK